jgi:hypothetical protein
MATTMQDALREVASTGCPALIVVDLYGTNNIKGILSNVEIGDKVVTILPKYEYIDDEWWADSTQPPKFIAIDKIVTLTYAEEG